MRNDVNGERQVLVGQISLKQFMEVQHSKVVIQCYIPPHAALVRVLDSSLLNEMSV